MTGQRKTQGWHGRVVWLLLFAMGAVTEGRAAELAPALQAWQKGDLETVIRELTPPARAGNATAAYDLGLAIRQRNGDDEASRLWYREAARQGLVQAYTLLQAGAVRPAPATRALVILTPDDWIRQQNPRHYTLQLASSTNRKLIEKYYRQNRLEGMGGYYRNRRDGQDWYALVYGAYPSVSEAKAAIEALPEALRKWSPWVRRLRDIQRIMQPLEVASSGS